jgi:adenine-specific DNA-methyltransferase
MTPDSVRLTWTRRGQHVLRDDATGRLSFAGELPSFRLVEDRAFGTEEGQPFDPGRSDLLIKGENLLALFGLLPHYAGKVDLIYIDPPFNTHSGFPDYFDDFDHDAYLSMMEVRMSLAREILRPGGILAIHTDREEQPYVRVLLDELFGRKHLVAQVSWQRAPDRTVLGQGSSLVNDCVEYVTVFSNGPVRTDLPVPHKEEPLSWKTLKSYSRVLRVSEDRTQVDEFPGPSGDTVRIFAHHSFSLSPLGAENSRKAASGSWNRLRSVFPRIVRLTNQQKESTFQQELIRRMPEKDVFYSAEYVQARGKHKGPRTRYYLNGQVVLFLKDVARLQGGSAVRVADMNNLWTDDEVPATGIAAEGGVVLKRGKKPEKLLSRLIGAFSKEGDLVLDFFAGSGTTGAVAHKTGRRWVMVDASEEAVTQAQERMTRVISGEDQSGVTRETGWKGGGGFRVWTVEISKRQGPLPLPQELGDPARM